MCEMLVRVVDKVNTDPYLNAQCTKRGDVIAIQPDGWAWSHLELSSSQWRIIKVPGITVLEASAFLAPEVNIDPQNPSRVLQRRAFKLDVDALGAMGQGSTHTRAMNVAQLLSKKLTKAPLADPNVFV